MTNEIAEATAATTAAAPAARRITVEEMTQTDPGTLAGQYLRRYWQPVLMSEQLAAGTARPVKIMGETMTVYRGEGGGVHAVGNRCAHRCSQLSVGYVESDDIRCLYHGWKYNPLGECIEQPAEPALMTGGKRVKIESYPVFEYLGLIFVYMGEGEPPPRPRFPEFEAPGVCDVYFYERACNYFQNLENGVDEAHLAFTHRSSFFDVLNHDVPQIGAEQTEYGILQTGTRADGSVRYTHCLMPNLLSFAHPSSDDPAVLDWALYLSWRVPVDDTVHKSFIVEHFKVAPEQEQAFRERRAAIKALRASLEPLEKVCDAILAGDAQLSDYADRPDFVNLQDEVAQRAQDVNQDRTIERLGRSDVAIVMMRRLWARDMAAIAAGGDPYPWKYPEVLPRPKGV